MHLVTPTEITTVAWEGELVAPQTFRSFGSSENPMVSIGRPEIWPIDEILNDQTGSSWIPPLGDGRFWLVRLACTLHEPKGVLRLTEAQQVLSLRPKSRWGQEGQAYAFSLFPDRLGVDDEIEFNVSLAPELKFADGAEMKGGELSAKMTYRKVFPVIQSYGAGEPDPYWIFQRHPTYPLAGSQYVYAVVVAQGRAESIQAGVELIVTAEAPFGLARFGLSDEAREATRFTIP